MPKYEVKNWVMIFTSPCIQVFYLQQAEVTRERVYAMHQSSIDGVEDMSALAELHEAAIMHNLYQRYQKDCIYVSAFSEPYVSMSMSVQGHYVCLYYHTPPSPLLTRVRLLERDTNPLIRPPRL